MADTEAVLAASCYRLTRQVVGNKSKVHFRGDFHATAITTLNTFGPLLYAPELFSPLLSFPPLPLSPSPCHPAHLVTLLKVMSFTLSLRFLCDPCSHACSCRPVICSEFASLGVRLACNLDPGLDLRARRQHLKRGFWALRGL